MKKTINATIAIFIAFLMVFGSVPLSGIALLDFELPRWLKSGLFTLQSSAEESGIYTYNVSNGNATITGCNTSASGSISIPGSLGGYPVTIIGVFAFSYCSYLTKVIIPDSVTTIESGAFNYCDSLTSITIPDSVTSIQGSAFSGCSALSSIIIPDSVTSIQSSAFSGCSGLTSVTISNSVTSIGISVFSGCSELTSVSIPSSVTSIGEAAFKNCSKMLSVDIPYNVKSIGASAFLNCSSLTSVIIPSSTTSIGRSAFERCGRLTNVTIPNSITSIGDYAFSHCTGLTCFAIPNRVTTIQGSVFSGCIGLTSVSIPISVRSIKDFAFNNCVGLTSITIPNSVTSIGYGSFQNCSGLTRVTIPNSVTHIVASAFDGCSNLTIYGLPNSYAKIYAASKYIPFIMLISNVIHSGCVVDNGMIYGLTPSVTRQQLESLYLEICDGYSLFYTDEGLGTGTNIDVTENSLPASLVISSFMLVIYGDVNGDGNIDSIDAGTMVDYENYTLIWNPVTDAVYIKAGDLNGDGCVDSIDAGIAIDVENYLLGINQTTGIASVKTSLDGTISITGTAKYGEMLTADISGVLPTGATVSYVWKRGKDVIGTGRTYAVTAEDIGKSITVTVTGNNVYEGSLRSSAVSPQKADKPAPSAPIILDKTPYTVSLQSADGQEYKIEGGEWQSNADFTGLNANTAYNFYTRVAETDTYFASPSSVPRSVTTYSNTITGTVAITGTAFYGATLSAVITNLSPTVASYSYHWYRGNTVVGNDLTYSLTTEDVGQSITFSVFGTGDYTGSISSNALIPTKATVEAPSAPILLSKTSSSVTLTAIPGQEYKIEGGAWQASVEFASLNPNVTYNFSTRLAETSTHFASPASAVLPVTTNKAAISGTVAITGTPNVGGILTANTSGISPAGATVSYKWISDGVQVGISSTYTVNEVDLDTSITVTVTGTGAYEGSITSQIVLIT